MEEREEDSMTKYEPCMETDNKAQQIVTCPLLALWVNPSGEVEHSPPDFTWVSRNLAGLLSEP